MLRRFLPRIPLRSALREALRGPEVAVVAFPLPSTTAAPVLWLDAFDSSTLTVVAGRVSAELRAGLPR